MLFTNLTCDRKFLEIYFSRGFKNNIENFRHPNHFFSCMHHNVIIFSFTPKYVKTGIQSFSYGKIQFKYDIAFLFMVDLEHGYH